MESNAEWLRGAFERFNETGELDMARAHPDFELHDRPDVPDARVWRGTNGVQQFLSKTAEHFDPIRWEPCEFVERGRHVIVDVHVVAYGASSGAPIEVDEHQLWTFDVDGRVVRLQAFATADQTYETARALDEAEGIRP
jgi:ketosteroid isomerase-like protein